MSTQQLSEAPIRVGAIGAVVHYVHEGRHLPAIVVSNKGMRWLPDGRIFYICELQVFAGNGSFVVEKSESDETTKAAGTWHAPEPFEVL